MKMNQLLSQLTPEQARKHVVIKNKDKSNTSGEITLSINLGDNVVPLDVLWPGTTVLKVKKDQVLTVIEDLKGAINRGAFDDAFAVVIKKYESYLVG